MEATTRQVAEQTLEAALRTHVDFLVSPAEVSVTLPWRSSLRVAHENVDDMLAALGDSDVSASQLRRDLVEVERLKRRVDAVRLRLIAKAEARSVPESTGFVDTGAWVASATKGDRRPSASDTHLARAMGESSAKGDASGRALDDGRISAEHAKVIARGLDDLPETITPGQRIECEEELVRLAWNRSPSQVRVAARRVLAKVESETAVVDAHEEQIVQSQEERARERAAFWIKDNHDGTMTGHFTVPWVSGATVKKVIDAMTAPRRQTAAVGAEAGRQSAAGTGVGAKAAVIDWQHRRGLAFADLLTRIPTDHLHHKVAATILVSTRLGDLSAGLDAASLDATSLDAASLDAESLRVGSTDTGDVISAGTTRRLACEAGIIPTVLGSDSLPLDLGRQVRLFAEHQRAALSTRYTECAAEGCDRPFAWTEVHHMKAWQHGGRTDLANAVPLCGRHHHMIDGPNWAHTATRRPDGTVKIRYHQRT